MNHGRMKVCILRSTAVNPDPRVMKVGCWLTEKGYKVKVIGWDRECSSEQKEEVDGIRIERLRLPSKYGSGFKNILWLFLFNLWLIFKLFKENPDIVHSCDFDTVLPAIFFKKIKRKKLVYDIFDFYAESRYVGPLYRVLFAIEKWAICQSELIIIAHEKRIKQIGRLPSHIEERIIVIYNTPEKPANIRPWSRDISLPFFSYVGILAFDRGLPSIIKTVAELKEIGMVFAGFGPLEKELEKAAQTYPNIWFLGKVSYEEALVVQNSSIAMIALYDPTIPNNVYAAPNKLYEAAMLGKPLITSKGTLAADIVEKEGLGITVFYDDNEALSNAVLKLYSNTLYRQQIESRGKAFYEEKCSDILMKQNLQVHYEKLFGRER
jgi:glycosyltransferase involved in cell wall biosynthesis